MESVAKSRSKFGWFRKKLWHLHNHTPQTGLCQCGATVHTKADVMHSCVQTCKGMCNEHGCTIVWASTSPRLPQIYSFYSYLWVFNIIGGGLLRGLSCASCTKSQFEWTQRKNEWKPSETVCAWWENAGIERRTAHNLHASNLIETTEKWIVEKW